jgi:putative molybdopterin biosynthesis protein
MAEHKIYLEDIPLAEAWARLERALAAVGRWEPLPAEEIPVAEALGRVTAAPVWARVSSPAYHASAMDGYAVRAADTRGASESAPLALTRVPRGLQIPAGGLQSFAGGVTSPSGARPAAYVDTGDPLPPWADAVIMIEHVQTLDHDRIEIMAPIAPWQNVRPLGEDMVATELVLPANHVLAPVDLGAIAGSGHATVSVRRRARVAVIPSGTELITVEQAAGAGVQPGEIVEYNSLVLAAQVTQWGGEPARYPIVPDDYPRIVETLRAATAAYDLVLLNAGSSAGSEDFSARAVAELGELLVHGIAVRPGHPVILGMVGATPVIGVPGYPVSAALTGEIFVEPLLARWRGCPPLEKPAITATITRKLLSPMGEDEWVRVTAGQVGARVVAAPLSRGAGVITSLVRADGIVRIPRFSEGVDAGQAVTVELYRAPSELARTLVAIGSHDLTLDLLAQFYAERHPGLRLSSANAGSLGGLLALARGEAHLAGAHLLDEASGTYNWPYVERYLPDKPVALITLVQREQGLIVPRGNPQGIRGLGDLARPDVLYVNRQRGAGTRILLDYRLRQLGIAPEQVRGYAREEYTHLAVAAAVASGAASCGLGIRAAARALELDCVPLEEERYDLVIPQEFLETDLMRRLLDLLHDAAFRAAVAALPGYNIAHMGERVEAPC